MKDQILHPKHPERICWGCDRYCPADDLACGNGTIRTAHLVELFGDDWLDWAERREANRGKSTTSRSGDSHVERTRHSAIGGLK